METTPNTPLRPQPGSYRYFAQEWGTFMLCDDMDVTQTQLQAAMGGLIHLSGTTEDAPPTAHVDLETAMSVALKKYHRKWPDHPWERPEDSPKVT
jgi:hypothetical protein